MRDVRLGLYMLELRGSCPDLVQKIIEEFIGRFSEHNLANGNHWISSSSTKSGCEPRNSKDIMQRSCATQDEIERAVAVFILFTIPSDEIYTYKMRKLHSQHPFLNALLIEVALSYLYICYGLVPPARSTESRFNLRIPGRVLARLGRAGFASPSLV